MSKKDIWIVTGESESGDRFGPVMFIGKPSDAELKTLAVGWESDKELDGPGDYGSYVHLEIVRLKMNES